ncbi:MAG: MFS transporter [Acidiferrobacter sp.]
MDKETPRRNTPMHFVIRLGIVSLFADFTYEGSHAILGSFLAKLGATPFLVGLVAGFGEMLGYGIRLFTGRYADKTRRYWPIMGVGYAVNLLAVPALALTTTLAPAVALIFSERLGKGLRTPSRNVVLAQAGEELGHGRAFGLHGLLDQIGAFLGPLTIAGLVLLGGYRLAFAFLLLPALLALTMLHRAHALTPTLKHPRITTLRLDLPPLYFWYLAFAMVTVMGFAHFIVFAYHLTLTHRLAPPWIPVLYALAMAASGLTAIPAGALFDRIGLRVLYGVPLLILATNPLLFLARSPFLICLGAILWGIALGIQGSTMRAAITRLSEPTQRGSAYGLFDAGFGLAWMIGSMAMGALYALAPRDLVWFASAAELLGIALLSWVLHRTPISA